MSSEYKGTSQAVERREHDLEKEAKRVELTDPFGGLVTELGNYITIIDAVNDSTTYVGMAQIGTLASSALWQIRKILTVSTITTITWAGGTDAFTQVWDDRSSLSYS